MDAAAAAVIRDVENLPLLDGVGRLYAVLLREVVVVEAVADLLRDRIERVALLHTVLVLPEAP